MRKLLWFCVIGGIGFVVDISVLTLLLNVTPLGPLVGRAVAIVTAMFVTWILNRTFTFSRSGHSLAEEGIRYGSVGIISALVNYFAYTIILISTPTLPPVEAVVIASIFAMTLSFLGYSRFVFKQ